MRVAATDDAWTAGLSGYSRADGSWGVRNHLLVLPARTSANRAAALLAEGVPGAVAVAHEWDALPDDPDREIVSRTLVGFACNPNVAGALVVCALPEDCVLADAITARRREARTLVLSDYGGTARGVEAGHALVRELLELAADAPRRAMPASALAIGLECGGSDALSGVTANPALGVASDRLVAAGATTILAEVPELVGAEQLLAARAVSPEVGRQVIDVIHDFERSVEALGVDIRGAQPTPGNIDGGLTTIEEKSLGAAKKAGRAAVSGVLSFGQAPDLAGLYIMDTPGHDIEQMVGLAAGGCQIVAFTTGRGTPTGSPIAPCLKISTNTATFERMADDIDLDAGAVLDGSQTLESMGALILSTLAKVAAGQPTSSELRGNREFALRRG